MVGLMVGSIAAGGTKSADPGSNGPTQLEYARATSIFAQATKTEPGEDFYLLISSLNSNSNSKVSDPAFRQVVTQVTNKLKETSYSANGQSSPLFRQVVDPYSVPLTAGLISPDQTTVRIYAVVPGEDSEIKARLEVLKPVVKDLKGQFSGYQVLAINHTWINQDVTKNILDELDGSLKITIPLTFLFLLVAFGAVGASVVPLITALTALLGAFGLMGFYSQLIDPVDVSTSSLIVLIGLAVAVDYSLFMITRFRTEKRRGRSKLEALEVASSTAGRAVFFSGLTVMISLAGLLTIQGSSFHSIAAGTIAVVLLSVVASLTFLPALLSIMNNKVNFLRLPYLGRDREEGSGLWSKLVQTVMRRPVISGAIVLIIVLVMSYPLLNLRLGQVGTEGLPQKSEGIQALNFQKTKWPQGLDLTVNTVVTGADRAETKAAMAKYIEAGLKLPGLAQPVKTVYSPDGTVAKISMTMSGEVNDEANFALVKKLRKELAPTYLKDLPGVEAYVGGDTATSLDIKQIFTDATPTVFAFVLGLSFLLLMLVFRSVVIPVKAIILNLLSTGAAYGMLVLVFQEGWFNDWLDIKASATIASSVPLFVFTVLFGLSMDYHLFILTRVKEGRDQGLNTREAVAHGISTTSGTITSAASIMVMVFAVFVTLHYATVRQLGLGLAVAVFVDAAFIRSILLPASMELLGEWNWYLPRFLNWLPRFQIELEPIPTSTEIEEEKVA
jgi:RND superfamily putative drug exporter